MENIRKELIEKGFVQIEKENELRDVYEKDKTIVTVVKGKNEIEWTFQDEKIQ